MRTTRRKKSHIFPVLLILVVLAAGIFYLVPKLRIGMALSSVDDAELRTGLTAMAEKNPEASEFVYGFKGVTDYDGSIDISGDVVPGEIPYFKQWDSRWGYCRYGDGLIGYTGCGPTCLSMVLVGLTGDTAYDPAYVADFASENGYCVYGNGTAWALFSDGAASLGLEWRELSLSCDSMTNALNSGSPIICIMGPGDFTESGHYIVITDYDGTGFSVYDPYRPSNNEKKWDYDTLAPQIRNLWSYSA